MGQGLRKVFTRPHGEVHAGILYIQIQTCMSRGLGGGAKDVNLDDVGSSMMEFKVY